MTLWCAEIGWLVAEIVKVYNLKIALWCAEIGRLTAEISKVRDKRLVESLEISKVGLSLL